MKVGCKYWAVINNNGHILRHGLFDENLVIGKTKKEVENILKGSRNNFPKNLSTIKIRIEKE